MTKKNVYYPLYQTWMIGQLSCEIQTLRSLFPVSDYYLNIITYPLAKFSGINIDLFAHLTQDINILFSNNRAVVEANQDIRATPDKIGINHCNNDIYVGMPPEKLVELGIRQFGRAGLPWQSKLSGNETMKAMAIREHLDIPPDAKIVTIHVRDEYNIDSRHYYKYRNADINNYIPAIRYLVEQGYYVIRLGDTRMRKLEIVSNQVIDGPFCDAYSNCFDMFMIAQSSFYIGMQSGPLTVAHVFGVPVLLANAYYCYGICGYAKGLMIPKKYYSTPLNRYLTLAEILHSPLLNYNHTDMFGLSGIELHENTSVEIFAAVKELESRVSITYSKNLLYDQAIDLIWNNFREYNKLHPPSGGYMVDAIEYIQISHEFIKLHPSYTGHYWPAISSDEYHRIL
jgi:putative glycosyltransferase (TIGR04372 family)